MTNTACIPPAISVIIPVYNAEAFLQRCLESLIRQLYTNFEVILVDDGSQDGSRRLCTRFCEADTRFRLITQSNAGVDKARNAGLNAARSEYIAFMDADDWAEADWLKAYMDAQEQCPCDLVVQGTVVDDAMTMRHEILPENIYMGKAVIEGIVAVEKRGLSGFIHNKMYRTAIIREHRLAFDFTFKEDLLFNLTYYNHIHSMMVIGQAFYHYMQHSGPSLIKKRYPAQYMLAIFTQLCNAGITLAESYQNSEYACSTWQRYLTDYAIQIAGLYNKQHKVQSKELRINIIKTYQQARRERPDAKPYFHDRTQKVFEKVALLPPSLCDSIFRLLFGVLNQIKK